MARLFAGFCIGSILLLSGCANPPGSESLLISGPQSPKPEELQEALKHLVRDANIEQVLGATARALKDEGYTIDKQHSGLLYIDAHKEVESVDHEKKILKKIFTPKSLNYRVKRRWEAKVDILNENKVIVVQCKIVEKEISNTEEELSSKDVNNLQFYQTFFRKVDELIGQ